MLAQTSVEGGAHGARSTSLGPWRTHSWESGGHGGHSSAALEMTFGDEEVSKTRGFAKPHRSPGETSAQLEEPVHPPARLRTLTGWGEPCRCRMRPAGLGFLRQRKKREGARGSQDPATHSQKGLINQTPHGKRTRDLPINDVTLGGRGSVAFQSLDSFLPRTSSPELMAPLSPREGSSPPDSLPPGPASTHHQPGAAPGPPYLGHT